MSIRYVLLLMAMAGITGSLLRLAAQPGYITLRGDQFYDEFGVPFFPMQMSFYVDSYSPIAPLPADPNAAEMATVEFGRYIFHNPDDDLTYPFALGQGAEAVLQDLKELKAQGFNTIRYLQQVAKKPSEDGFLWNIKPYPLAWTNSMVNMDPPYSADPGVNPVSAAYFDMILQVCDLANTIGMKVSLEPGLGVPLLASNPGDAVNLDDLAFLQALGSFLHQQQVHNLLAYEFYGEPSYSAYENSIQKSRVETCELVTTWNSAMKSADPDHLTTLGGGYVREVMKYGWDPMAFPVDYVNIHPYPIFARDEGFSTYLQSMTTRYLDWIRYYDRFLKKPFIVGETGFAGEDPYSPPDYTVFNPYLHYPFACYGDEQDQDDFFRNTFAPIRDSRCAGYGVWIFHNVAFWADDPNLTNTDPGHSDYFPFSDFKERYFGLLRFGAADPTPAPGTTGWEQHRKIAAQTFADWAINPPDPAPMAPVPSALNMNDSYFNPFLHPVNTAVWPNGGGAPWNYGTHSGRVVDQDGQPIAGAMILGKSLSSPTVTNDFYTFTDDDGYYEIRAKDLLPAPGPTSQSDYDNDPWNTKDRTIVSLEVGAYASGSDGYGWAGSDFTQATINPILNSLQARYDVTLDGVSVPTGVVESFSGISTLTAQNTTISGTADLKARYDVNLKPGFHAWSDSECHIYTEPLNLSCDDVDDADLRLAPAEPIFNIWSPYRNLEGIVDVNFHFPQDDLHLELNPNPAVTEVQVSLIGADIADSPLWQVAFLDAMGRSVLSLTLARGTTTVDVRPLASGSYTVLVRTSGSTLKGLLVKP